MNVPDTESSSYIRSNSVVWRSCLDVFSLGIDEGGDAVTHTNTQATCFAESLTESDINSIFDVRTFPPYTTI